jgi:hypothetical protein
MTTARKFMPAIAACVALLAVGVANIDVQPTKTVTVHVRTPPKVITKIRTKLVREKVRPADGYITRAECLGLVKHTAMRDFIARYGWPAHIASDLGRLYYPLVEDHHQLCAVTPDQGQIYDVGIYDDLDTL